MGIGVSGMKERTVDNMIVKCQEHMLDSKVEFLGACVSCHI